MAETHPGDDWSRYCPADSNIPPVIINGWRSIVCAWPPGATCGACGAPTPSGYSGPTDTQYVSFPNRDIRFFCVQCVFQALGAQTGEYLGHQCVRCALDDVDSHVEVVLVDRGFHELEMPQRLAVLESTGEYRRRGFVLDRATPAPSSWRLPKTLGEWSELGLHPRQHMAVTLP